MFSIVRIFFLVGFVLLMHGCALLKPAIDTSKLTCPETGLIHEAEDMQIFAKDGTKQAYVMIKDFSGQCSFDNNDGLSVMIDAKLFFYAERSPDASFINEQSFEYFVTILSPTNEILAKKIFPATIALDEDAGVGVLTEEIEHNIPLARIEHAGLYKIVFGLQLKPENKGN